MKKCAIEQGRDSSQKKVLTLNFQSGDIGSLSPHDLAVTARGLALGKWLFEGLVRLDPNGEYVLTGAERVQISPDQKSYTFYLRPSLYSDGSKVLASDYERSWKEALSLESKCQRAHLFYVIKNAEKAKKGEVPLEQVGIKALDDQTLFVELTHPTPYFLSLISSPLFFPFKRKEGAFIGNGLYAVDQWKKGEHLTLTLNGFFDNQGRNSIEVIHILMLENEVTVFDLYRQGQLDWIGPPFSPFSAETLTEELNKGTLIKQEITRPFWLFVNTKIEALSSRTIRQALSCAIDRYKVAEHIFIGDKPLLSPLPLSLSVCNVEVDNADLIKARQLFEKGIKELGLTRETFPQITLSGFRHSSHKRLIQYLKERWEQVFGIEVHLESHEWPTLSNKLHSGNYEIGGCFCGVDYHDSLALLEQLAVDDNCAQWEHQQYRGLVKRAKETIDPDKRLSYLKEAEEILQEEMPIIPIVNQSQYYSLSSDVKGVVFNYRGTPDLYWAYLNHD